MTQIFSFTIPFHIIITSVRANTYWFCSLLFDHHTKLAQLWWFGLVDLFHARFVGYLSPTNSDQSIVCFVETVLPSWSFWVPKIGDILLVGLKGVSRLVKHKMMYFRVLKCLRKLFSGFYTYKRPIQALLLFYKPIIDQIGTPYYSMLLNGEFIQRTGLDHMQSCFAQHQKVGFILTARQN